MAADVLSWICGAQPPWTFPLCVKRDRIVKLNARCLPEPGALHGLMVEILDGLGAVADWIGDERIDVVPLLSQANSGYQFVCRFSLMDTKLRTARVSLSWPAASASLGIT